MSRQMVPFNFNFGQSSQQHRPTVVNGSLWKRFFGGRRKLALDLLPADIIVDEIMSRLNMRDIGALRRVSSPCLRIHVLPPDTQYTGELELTSVNQTTCGLETLLATTSANALPASRIATNRKV